MGSHVLRPYRQRLAGQALKRWLRRGGAHFDDCARVRVPHGEPMLAPRRLLGSRWPVIMGVVLGSSLGDIRLVVGDPYPFRVS